MQTSTSESANGLNGSAGRNSLRSVKFRSREHLIDDYRLAYDTYRTSTQFKFTDASWAVSKAAGGTD